MMPSFFFILFLSIHNCSFNLRVFNVQFPESAVTTEKDKKVTLKEKIHTGVIILSKFCDVSDVIN